MASFISIIDSIKDLIRQNKPLPGRGCTIEENSAGSVININPIELPVSFVPVKITAAKDVNNLYTGDVYGNGSQTVYTIHNVKIGIHGMDIDESNPQWFYLARPAAYLISGTLTKVYEVFPNIPKLPDLTNTYFLMSIAGKVQWIRAGDCSGVI